MIPKGTVHSSFCAITQVKFSVTLFGCCAVQDETPVCSGTKETNHSDLYANLFGNVTFHFTFIILIKCLLIKLFPHFDRAAPRSPFPSFVLRTKATN